MSVEFCKKLSFLANMWGIWFDIVTSLCVTIDGVWIGERIYWPLTHTTWKYNYSATINLHNSQITTAPSKPFPACCVHQPFHGNGLCQWRFFSFTLPYSIFISSRSELLKNCLCLLLTEFWHGSRRSAPFPTVNILLHAYLLSRERVYRAVAQKLSLVTA
jgi:hypothetical protein